ncbi:hypothetical protein KUM39_04560 [Streptomyces sp. J2-1]|nr:hypothetical protein [Streptomyces corallincola]
MGSDDPLDTYTADACAVELSTPLDWLGFDAGARAPWAHIPPDTPYAPSPTALLRDAPLPDTGTAWLALALCNHDGRLRERAVRAGAGHPALAPLLVVRCADWAEPVREAARAALIPAVDATVVIGMASLLLRLSLRLRGDFAVPLLDGVLRHTSLSDWSALLRSPDPAVRRFAYGVALDEGLLTPVELARAAAGDDDPVVRDRCADAAVAKAGVADADAVLGPLLGASATQARAAGVSALRRLGRPDAAVPYLADRAALVRACARYVLRQYGRDPLTWYRARCADPADPTLEPGAVIGLAECGVRTADAETLRALLDHPSTGVRSRAVAGLRALDVNDISLMRALLDDPASGVVREATLALLPSAALLPEPWLLARLAPGRPRCVRVSAYRLLSAQGPEAGLRAARELVEDADARLRRHAQARVRPPRRGGGT